MQREFWNKQLHFVQLLFYAQSVLLPPVAPFTNMD